MCYFVCLGEHIVAVSVRPNQLDTLSYAEVYLSYMMWLLIATKYISSSILAMVPFAFIPHENEQNIINVGIRIIISDSYDINQRFGPIKLV